MEVNLNIDLLFTLFSGNTVTASKPSILFVDDDTNILNALARVLRGRRKDWDLTFVDSGETAVQKTETRRFDVVVTDLAMPGMSGLEVVQALNKTSPETSCIILTGTADLQAAAEIINTVQVFRFYTKPCAPDVLVEGILSALSNQPRSTSSQTKSQNGPENTVLDRLSTGVFVVTRKGKVAYMNQAAAQTVAAGDGLSIGFDQVLRASTSEENNALQDIYLQLDDAPADSELLALSIERPSLGAALKLIFSPLDDQNDTPEGQIIIFVTDPDRNLIPSAEMISRFFELTPTESRLARELIRGLRTEEIAVSMGVTLSSARTYLKRVMEKTGTNRQVDLVRLLLSTPQIIPRPDEVSPQP
jgi:FixJ family two-component response regulator